MKLWKPVYSFVVNTEPADGPALIGGRASAGTVMTKFKSDKSAGPVFGGRLRWHLTMRPPMWDGFNFFITMLLFFHVCMCEFENQLMMVNWLIQHNIILNRWWSPVCEWLWWRGGTKWFSSNLHYIYLFTLIKMIYIDERRNKTLNSQKTPHISPSWARYHCKP